MVETVRRSAVVLALAAGTVPAGIVPAATAEPLAIVDVRLFDGERTLPRATVVVRDGVIVAAGAGMLWTADRRPVRSASRSIASSCAR